MRRISMTAISLIVFLLEASFLPFLCNGAWQPDLWLILIGVSALVFERRYAILFSILGGISQDLITGSFFGIHLVPYLVVSFLITSFVKEKYNRHWYVSVAVVMLGTAVFSLLSLLVLYAGYGILPSFLYVLSVAAPLILLNAAGAIIFHNLLWSMRYEGESRW